ncbi:hypothetical protein EIP91_005099 [Steccherinum ochraceum]|uniref:Uncharacterized protein n=1 Tax=Steccherinum ochraceum TaxID=92696 RepID=A0A4R0RMZ0_9APHY|nr:hypothetical protein EIP91_005099 [Steccherinum ochraceum]
MSLWKAQALHSEFNSARATDFSFAECSQTDIGARCAHSLYLPGVVGGIVWFVKSVCSAEGHSIRSSGSSTIHWTTRVCFFRSSLFKFIAMYFGLVLAGILGVAAISTTAVPIHNEYNDHALLDRHYNLIVRDALQAINAGESFNEPTAFLTKRAGNAPASAPHVPAAAGSQGHGEEPFATNLTPPSTPPPSYNSHDPDNYATHYYPRPPSVGGTIDPVRPARGTQRHYTEASWRAAGGRVAGDPPPPAQGGTGGTTGTAGAEHTPAWAGNKKTPGMNSSKTQSNDKSPKGS